MNITRLIIFLYTVIFSFQTERVEFIGQYQRNDVQEEIKMNDLHEQQLDINLNIQPSSKIIKLDLSLQQSQSDLLYYWYALTIKVGRRLQEFQVQFDLNSTESWIPGSGCSEYYDEKILTFYEQQYTYRCFSDDGCMTYDKQAQKINLDFYQGKLYETGYILGNQVSPSISIGGLQPFNSDFILARGFYSNFFSIQNNYQQVQGQIGLGTPQQQSSFLNSLKSNGIINDQLYSFYFQDKIAQLTIGGYNTRNYNSNIQFFKADFQQSQQWRIKDITFIFGNFTKSASLQFQMTPYIYFSDDIYFPLMSYLNTQYNITDGEQNIKCSKNLSNFIFKLRDVNGTDTQFPLSQQSYLLKINSLCRLQIRNIGNIGGYNGLIIVGYEFMKQYPPLFSYSNSTIGLGLSILLNNSQTKEGLSDLDMILILAGSFLVLLFILFVLYKKCKRQNQEDQEENLNDDLIQSDNEVVSIQQHNDSIGNLSQNLIQPQENHQNILQQQQQSSYQQLEQPEQDVNHITQQENPHMESENPQLEQQKQYRLSCKLRF